MGLDWIETATKIAGAITAVAAVGALAWKPISKYRARKAAKQAEFERKMLEGIAGLKIDIGGVKADVKSLEESVSSRTDDVSELQGDRLGQAHRYWMGLGWCPAGEKSKLVAWHAKYRAKGYNHLADSYERDILDLPDMPANDGGK